MNNLRQVFNHIISRTTAKSMGTAGSFSGLCPSHDDNSASMSITMENDRILLYCHTGCTIDDICTSLGIEKYDLFSSNDKTLTNKVPIPLKLVKEQKRMKANINADSKVVFFSSKHNKNVTESVRYSYINADGKTAYHVIRSDPKDFRPMTPDGFLDFEGVERLPYRLP